MLVERLLPVHASSLAFGGSQAATFIVLRASFKLYRRILYFGNNSIRNQGLYLKAVYTVFRCNVLALQTRPPMVEIVGREA